jgi:hypothetical protein
MQRALMCSAAGLALTAATAAADPPQLKGDYAFTGEAGCLFAPGSSPPAPTPAPGTPRANAGFNANLTPVDGRVFSRTHNVEGIRHFNGDGTGTVKATEVGIVPPPTPPPGGSPSFPPDASSSTFSFSFTYAVNGDGSWTTDMVPGSYTGTILTGPRTGQTYSVDKLSFVGLIGAGAKVLTAATVAPIVETVTYSNGDAWPRICHRSRVLVKMLSGDDDDHGGDRDRN